MPDSVPGFSFETSDTPALKKLRKEVEGLHDFTQAALVVPAELPIDTLEPRLELSMETEATLERMADEVRKIREQLERLTKPLTAKTIMRKARESQGE